MALMARRRVKSADFVSRMAVVSCRCAAAKPASLLISGCALAVATLRQSSTMVGPACARTFHSAVLSLLSLTGRLPPPPPLPGADAARLPALRTLPATGATREGRVTWRAFPRSGGTRT